MICHHSIILNDYPVVTGVIKYGYMGLILVDYREEGSDLLIDGVLYLPRTVR
jgi:hypothetical protein